MTTQARPETSGAIRLRDPAALFSMSAADTSFLYYVRTGRDDLHTRMAALADALVAKRRPEEVFGT